MNRTKPTYEELEQRCRAAEAALAAIRSGQVDTVIGEQGLLVLRLKEAEAALGESEERYRHALDDLLEGVQIIDREWRYVYVNDAVARQGHSTRDKLLGRTMMDAYPGIEQTELFSNLRQCMQKQTSIQMENEFTYPDGAKGWFYLSIEPMQEGALILSFDITERKRAEEMLSASEERHRLISELISDYIYILRVEPDGKYTVEWMSGSFGKFSGFSMEEAIAKGGPFSFIHPESIANYKDIVARVINGETVISEVQMISKSGSPVWIRVYNRPVWDETHARIIRIIGAAQDITEQKQAEAKLSESERLYRRAMEVGGAVPYYESYYDNATRVKYEFIGEGIRQITGYGPEEFTAGLWDTLLEEANPVDELAGYSLEEAIKKVRSGEVPTWKCEFRIHARDGSIHWVYEAAVELRDENGFLVGSIGSYQDITARKQADAEIQSLAKFPGENPNPVLRVARDGRLLYANPSSQPLLEYWQRKVGESLPEQEYRLANDAYASGAIQENEVKHGETVYSLMFWPVSGMDYLNIYGRDITERKQAEEKLRQSEERYRFLLDNTSDFIAIFDRNGIMKFGTEASRRFNGYQPEEIVNTPAFERIHPEDQEKVREELERMIHGNADGRAEYRIKRKDGEYIWVEASGRRVFNAAGEPELIVVQRDVTGRKQAEDALTASESKLRALFASMTDVVIAYDGEGRYVEIAPTNPSNLYRPADTLLGRPVHEILPKELADYIVARIRKTLESGQVVHSEYALQIDGKEVWFSASSSLLSGNRVIWVAHDITERKQAEQKLHESEVRFRTVADFTYDWEYWLDELGGFLYISPSCERVTGYTRDEFDTDPNLLQTIVHPEDQKAYALHLEDEVNTQEHCSLDFRIIHSDGQVRWISHSCQRVYDRDGQPHGRRISNRDITERKQAEDQAAALERFSHATLNALSANICVIDQSGTIVMVNQSWRSFALYNGADPSTLSEGANYFTACENAVGTERQQANEFASGIRLVLNGKCAEFSMEYSCHSGNEKRWFLARVTRFQASDANQAVISHMNITGRKLTEEALQVSEERFSTIFHSSPNPIAITRLADGKLIDMNNSWQTITGYAWEEAIGRSPIDLNLWVDPAERARLTQKVADHESVRAFEMQLRSKYGNIHTLLMSAEIVTLQGEMCILTAAQDITDLKQAERSVRLYTQQLQTAGEMGRMLASQLDVEKIYQHLTQAIKRLIPDVATVFVSRFSKEDQTISAVYGLQDDEDVDVSRLPPLPFAPAGQGSQSTVISTGKPVIVADLKIKTAGRLNVRVGSDDRDTQSAAYVPLVANEQILGVLQVQSYMLDRFQQSDIELLTLVGNTAAVAIQNAELFAETKQRVRELETVNHISVALRASVDQEQSLAIMLEETLNVFNTRHGAISLWDAETETLREAIARGWLAAVVERPIRSGEGIFGTVFASGETYVSSEFASDALVLPESRPLLPIGWGGACVAIRTDAKILGVLTLALPSRRALRRDDVRLLETLAEMVGTSINRMSLNEEVRRHLERLQSLRQIDAAITGGFSRSSTLDIILTQVISQLGVSAVEVLMLEPNTQLLNLAAYKGFIEPLNENIRVSVGESFAGTAVAEKRVVRADLQSVRGTPSFYKLWQREGFSSYHAIPLIVKDRPIGVLETYQRTLSSPNKEWFNFLEMLAGQAAIALENAGLLENLENANAELMQAYDSTIEGWSHALDLRDKETEGHTLRVADLTLELARAMGASPTELVHMRRGCLLHDIGKMGIPDRILLKPDKLTDDEWALMRMHPNFAYEMIEPIHYLKPAINIPYCHHEKWDGSGYPRGLVGAEIPLEARIFAVVDVWDALTSDRPYRPAWTNDQALEYIKEQSGRHFDPDVVLMFLRFFDQEQNDGLQSGA